LLSNCSTMPPAAFFRTWADNVMAAHQELLGTAMDRHVFATSEWLVIPFTKTMTDFAPAFRSFAISK
jgi:hypothetical protein